MTSRMTSTLMASQKTLILKNKNAASLCKIKTCGDEKIHPTGFEPVTFGSVEILLQLIREIINFLFTTC